MRQILSILVGVLLVATMVACSGDEPEASTREAANGDTVNEADVEFATELLRHDAETLLLVDQTLGRELDTELGGIAEATREELLLEIEELASLLEAWGEEVPETARDHANSHGDEEGDGKHHPYDDLATADAADFQRIWVAEMQARHQEAAGLADAAAEQGHHVTERAAEIRAARDTRMQELGELPIG